MNFARIVATVYAFSMITNIQAAQAAGNYTTVTVGKDGKLAFDPPYVSYDFVIDPISNLTSGGIRIQFYKADPPYDLTESTFEQPCVPKPEPRIEIPAMNVTQDRPFIEVVLSVGNATAWFHVSTASRCTTGMVFAVNPTWDQTYEAFKARAMGRNASREPTPTSASTKIRSSDVFNVTVALAVGVMILLGTKLFL